MPIRRVLLTILTTMTLAGSALAQRADPGKPDPDEPTRRSLWLPLLIGEHVAILTPPTIYYYATTDLQREDFELEWTWKDWKTKLTSFDAVAFDTGNWASNAFRHEIIGAGHYQISRTNGLGEVTSTLINVGTSALWEYVVEYRERISLNDMVVNSMSGFLIGEPMFELGRIADRPGTRWTRQAVSWIMSPVHRTHAAFGYSAYRTPPEPWVRMELALGAGVSDHGDGSRPDGRARADLEIVTDPRYGAPGHGTFHLGRGDWSRVGGEVRLDTDGRALNRFHTATIYGGRYGRDLDGDQVGADWSLTAAGGFEYETRPLAGVELDRTAIFHVLGPRFTAGRWNGPQRRLLWEVGGYGDLGMIQAQVFGPVPPFNPLPQTSVLRVRGYYYGAGASVSSRLALVTPGWRVGLEGRATRMWSIDGRDRVELDGATPNDPENVGDVRLLGRATVGFELPAGIGRLEGSLEGSVRRGTWKDRHRQTSESDLGVDYVVDL